MLVLQIHSAQDLLCRPCDRLYELNQEVVTVATEDERANALAWVVEKTGVEEWGRGWLVADGTHIKLAWKPALHAREHFSYQGNYLFNVSLVFLPHSLWIVKSIVGHKGSSHDLHVWASGDNGIVAKPCLHLDKGEFVWVDARFGFSAFSVGPFTTTQLARVVTSNTSTTSSLTYRFVLNMALHTSRIASNV
ncbi:uncharacterized protein UHOD_11361 [Ustilago sp. UG-2017b]|nr:uncharacterized protein UHOD_11361 [Ustilago sp. UG-2017b]